MRVLALTDHDTTNGLAEGAEAARALGIDFIPGLELNTDTDGGEVHILGYFPDFERADFQEALKMLRDARERRGQRIVERLNEHGIPISWERVREIAQGTVGRPHVAMALIEAGYVQSVSEAFDTYIGKGCVGYVPRYRLSPFDATRLIDSANGLPVIAQPLVRRPPKPVSASRRNAAFARSFHVASAPASEKRITVQSPEPGSNSTHADTSAFPPR